MSLQLFFDGVEVPLKQWLFPAKEVGVKFEVDNELQRMKKLLGA